MKVVYTLSIRSGVEVPVAPGVHGLTFDNGAVRWQSDDRGNLKAAILEFSDVAVSYTPEGSIEPAPAKLQEQAYRVASYIANQLYIQTSIDAIDPQSVLMDAPRVFPENTLEEAEFNKTPRRMWNSINLRSSIRGIFNPSAYARGFDHSAAHGYYADALRAATLFQKYELLYKIVEYFFSEDGPALDEAVSAYATVYDSTITPEAVKDLRLLRNRSVHPRARKGHISPENIASVREVRASIPILNKLVGLLFEHPTF